MSTPPYIEPIGSRAWVNLSVTHRFKFTSEYDTTTARNTILLAAPTTSGDFVRNDESVRSTQQPDGTVLVEVDYFHESLPEANIPLRTPEDGPEATFDTTGGTGKLTQKISLRDWAITASPGQLLNYIEPEEGSDPPAAPLDPADWELLNKWKFDGAIGVTPDHDVEGVDLVVPKLALSYRKLFYRADVTTTYIKNLARLTGSTNNASFKGFAAEELLFMGARGQTQGAFYSIEFIFDASENIDDFAPTGSEDWNPTPMVKKGHDYFWVWYQRVADDDEKIVRPKPIIAFSDQVYYAKDFSLLGIGT